MPPVHWPATSKKSIWGPALWIYLHTAATFCTDPSAFGALILSLVGTLPCPECRSHLKEYVDRAPPSASVRGATSALQYVQRLHDHVSALTKKKVSSAATPDPRLPSSQAAVVVRHRPPPPTSTSVLALSRRPSLSSSHSSHGGGMVSWGGSRGTQAVAPRRALAAPSFSWRSRPATALVVRPARGNAAPRLRRLLL